MHPGWTLALRDLLAKLDEQWQEATERSLQLTGKTPGELLDLLQGELALCVRWPSGSPLPEIALSVELGKQRPQWLEVVKHARETVSGVDSRAVEEREVAGVETTVWPGPAGPIFQTDLGTHLLVASSPSLLRNITEALESDDESHNALERSRFHEELAEPLRVHERELLVEVDVAAIYRAAVSVLGPHEQGEEVAKVLAFLGLDRLSAAGLALGFRDDGMEYAVHFAARDGLRGILQAIADGFGPLEVPLDGTENVLSRAPLSASGVYALNVAPGKIVESCLRLAEEYFPESRESFDDVFAQIKEKLGIDVPGELFPLARTTFFGFSATPPAGSVFADKIVLARTKSLTPYVALLKKLAEALGAELRPLPSAKREAGHSAGQYVCLASGSSVRDLWALLGKGETPDLTLETAFLLPSIAWAELPGGWTAISTLPQAIARYISHYSRGKKLAEGSVLTEHLRGRMVDASGISVFLSGRHLLWLYNSFLNVGGSFAPLLAQAGIDLGAVPPAEAFEGQVKPGYSRFRVRPDGLTLSGHRLLSSNGGWAAVFLGAAIVWSVGLPALQG
jgi:hypothetical protein